MARQAALRGLDPDLAQAGVDYSLASAAKAATRERIMDKWLRQWRLPSVANTARPTKRLLPGPGRQSLRIYQNLTKPQSSVLVQMRTMRIGLNHYLFKIKQVESDRCSCEEGSQTPKHVLLDCPKFSVLRLEMWRKIERVKGLPRNFDRYDYDQLVSEPKVVRLIANFVLATGLLQ